MIPEISDEVKAQIREITTRAERREHWFDVSEVLKSIREGHTSPPKARMPESLEIQVGPHHLRLVYSIDSHGRRGSMPTRLIRHLSLSPLSDPPPESGDMRALVETIAFDVCGWARVSEEDYVIFGSGLSAVMHLGVLWAGPEGWQAEIQAN